MSASEAPGAGYDLLQQASFDLSGSGGKLGIAGLIVLAAMFVAVVIVSVPQSAL